MLTYIAVRIIMLFTMKNFHLITKSPHSIKRHVLINNSVKIMAWPCEQYQSKVLIVAIQKM